MSSPPTAVKRRYPDVGKAIVMSCVAAGVAVVSLAVRSPVGPTYRGKPAGYDFSRWESNRSPSASEQRWPEDAGADAVPLLVEVLRLQDGRVREFVIHAWGKLPGLARDRMAGPRPADAIRGEAFERLTTIVETRDGMAELSRNFFRLPTDCQEVFLRCFGSLDGLTNFTVPLLTAAFYQNQDQRRQAASLSLLELGLPAVEILPDIARFLEQEHARAGQTTLPWASYCRLLGRIGPQAARARPLLHELKRNPDVKIRVEAGIALNRIEPYRQSLSDFLEREIIPQGREAVRQFFEFIWQESEAKPQSLPADDCLEVLVPLLDESAVREILTWRTAGANNEREAVNYLTTLHLQRTVAAIGALGSKAAPAVSGLTPLLSHRECGVRLTAARALRRIGPIAPESIPALVSAMADGGLHQPLVELLGGYGPLAGKAIPDLQALAAGRWRPHWLNAPPDINWFMFERYGLIPEGSATEASKRPPTKIGPELQKAAIVALEKIEVATQP
jgi:HEAT repeat protein